MSGYHEATTCPMCGNMKADYYWDSSEGIRTTCEKCGYDSDWVLDGKNLVMKKCRGLTMCELQEVKDWIDYIQNNRDADADDRILARREADA